MALGGSSSSPLELYSESVLALAAFGFWGAPSSLFNLLYKPCCHMLLSAYNAAYIHTFVATSIATAREQRFLPFAATATSGHNFDASCLIWDASVRRQSGLAIREIRVLK